MALSPKLELRQSQSLSMTPQLQQAIKLLRMNSIELAKFVASEVEQNPLLELRPAPTWNYGGSTNSNHRKTDFQGDILDSLVEQTTLREHVQRQIGEVRISPNRRDAAMLLADELDDDGYIRTPLSEFAKRYHLLPREAEAALLVVQSCDPPGIGARHLAECLSLQLCEKDRFDPAMRALVDNLSLLERGRTEELQNLCQVDSEDFHEMLAEIRALDPKPGRSFSIEAAQTAIPDVFVVRQKTGEWIVELNTAALPRVLVDNTYLSELRAGGESAQSFVSECSSSANWLIRSLEQRARTILRVATEIVRLQEEFFANGMSRMRPLTQKAIAENLKVHESTVSRVTAGKYLACTFGTFELKEFFSAAISSSRDDQSFSAKAIRDKIRHMIESEDRSEILSDGRIVAILGDDGIDIARRTVAKYRDGMGIPSSARRRRLKSSLLRA